jgi:hypothetical protein
MTRFVLIAILALTACKRGIQPTLPQIPDSKAMPSGGNLDLPEAAVFHSIYRYPGHAGQALAFYQPEMDRRGAVREGEGFVANMTHSGGFGSEGAATPVDPRQPGVWLAVIEIESDTRIDVWESVPKP